MSTKYKYKYFCPEHGETSEDAYTIESSWSKENLSYVAEECAEDLHDNRDGWESSWPLEFVILDEKGELEIGRFIIERESVPEFHATEKT